MKLKTPKGWTKIRSEPLCGTDSYVRYIGTFTLTCWKSNGAWWATFIDGGASSKGSTPEQATARCEARLAKYLQFMLRKVS